MTPLEKETVERLFQCVGYTRELLGQIRRTLDAIEGLRTDAARANDVLLPMLDVIEKLEGQR